MVRLRHAAFAVATQLGSEIAISQLSLQIRNVPSRRHMSSQVLINDLSLIHIYAPRPDVRFHVTRTQALRQTARPYACLLYTSRCV